MNGSERIAAERQRQIEEEGWTPEHDAEYTNGELAGAAIAYTIATLIPNDRGEPEWWPWDSDWWKPSDDPIRNLEKAGALLAAEIDRLERQEGEHTNDAE